MREAANNLIANIFKRCVPQFLTIYAGTSWAVVEFADFMVEEFLLSPHWTRVAPGSILLVPSVLMLAWSRGKAGPVYSICASG